MTYPILTLQDMMVPDHVLALVICIVAPFIVFSSRRLPMEDIQLNSKEKIKLYHANALFLLIAGLVVISGWRLSGKTMLALGFDSPICNNTVLILTGLVILGYSLDVFTQYGLKRWRRKSLAKKEGAMMFVPADTSEYVHFTTLAIAAGVGEEIIFRGFLIQYIVFWVGNDSTGLVFAAIFSSAIFAFLHGYQGYKSIVKIFFLSMLLAAIFIFSQSLVYVMIIHALIDLASGGLGAYFLSESETSSVNEDIE